MNFPFLVAVHGWLAIQTFFFVKILFLVRKISNLCEATFHENYLTSDFPIQTLLFQAFLPTRQNGVENRDTVFISVIPA